MKILLIICFIFSLVLAQSEPKKDWFEKNFGVTCPLPRIRRAFGAMTYDERKIYARTIYQMYLHKEAFLKDKPGANVSLFTMFATIHADSLNSMLHFTSAFALQHKAYLWMYESGLIYTAIKDGATMDPPITIEQACALTLPYWEWDRYYTPKVPPATTGNWNNIGNSDVFEYPDLLGDTSSVPVTMEVDTGLFSPLTSQFCKAEGKPLKRSFIPITSNSNFDLPYILSYPLTFTQFATIIHGQLHGFIHGYVGNYMAVARDSGFDPLFYMHHCNVDRLWHAWVDCRGWEFLEAKDLTATQYTEMNPIGITTPVADPRTNPKTPWPLKVTDKVNFYVNATTATFLPESDFPIIGDLWSVGKSVNERGWNGIYYRYGKDALTGPEKLGKAKYKCDQNWNILLVN